MGSSRANRLNPQRLLIGDFTVNDFRCQFGIHPYLTHPILRVPQAVRPYDPVIGRFTQQDSVMYTIQKTPTDQQIIEPLSLNLYAYAYQNPVKYRDPSGNMPEAFDTAAEIAQADGPYPIADLAAGGYLIYAGGKWVWTNRVEIANNFVSGAKFIGGKIADGAQWLIEEIQDSWSAITNLYKEHTNNARPSTKGKHEEGETRRQRNQNGEKGDARRKPNPNKRRQ